MLRNSSEFRRGPKSLDFLVIIIMEICKAPTLRLKALNKYSITHIMYIEMKMSFKKINMYISTCVQA